jgi:truncated hemoglobin YjbI
VSESQKNSWVGNIQATKWLECLENTVVAVSVEEAAKAGKF